MAVPLRRRPPDPAVSRPRILIIDDDDAMCEVLRQALADEGYAVATVPHGAAALELVKHQRPAVILCDLRMPIMDGWSFIEQYKRVARPPASVILLTAVKDAELGAERLGVVGVVKKPFELSEVIDRIHRAVAASS